jgi:hypothetical protein
MGGRLVGHGLKVPALQVNCPFRKIERDQMPRQKWQPNDIDKESVNAHCRLRANDTNDRPPPAGTAARTSRLPTAAQPGAEKRGGGSSPPTWAGPRALVQPHGQQQRNKYCRSHDGAFKLAAMLQALPEFDHIGQAPKSEYDLDRVGSQRLRPPCSPEENDNENGYGEPGEKSPLICLRRPERMQKRTRQPTQEAQTTSPHSGHFASSHMPVAFARRGAPANSMVGTKPF